MNDFSVLGLTPTFELSSDTLESAKLSRLGIVHSEAEKEAILHSAQRLKALDTRAQSLLELEHVQVSALGSIGDLAFLDHALELREMLEEAQSADALHALKDQASDWLVALGAEFSREFAAGDLEEALDTQSKLAFMVKLIEDIDSEIDHLDDPDELSLDHLF